MRQLLRNFPPRIVSRKCVLQSSARSTFDIAAAMPPSAITVCALPSNDLHTTPTLAPCASASIAARSPAPPAPMIKTSCSWDSYFSITTRLPFLRVTPLLVVFDGGIQRENHHPP